MKSPAWRAFSLAWQPANFFLSCHRCGRAAQAPGRPPQGPLTCLVLWTCRVLAATVLPARPPSTRDSVCGPSTGVACSPWSPHAYVRRRGVLVCEAASGPSGTDRLPLACIAPSRLDDLASCRLVKAFVLRPEASAAHSLARPTPRPSRSHGTLAVVGRCRRRRRCRLVLLQLSSEAREDCGAARVGARQGRPSSPSWSRRWQRKAA